LQKKLSLETIVGQDVLVCKAILENNGVVAIPTETVYGLAGNAMNIAAIHKIYEVKNRPKENPLIVHISSFQELEKYASDIPAIAYKLMSAFWPGPLTLLLKKKANIPDAATANSPLAAFRVPNHPLTLALLQSIDFPLVAPSANPFGYISPTSADHVLEQLNGKIPYILEGGFCEKGIESTIVGFVGEQAIIYRTGSLDIDTISFVLEEPVLIFDESTSKKPITSGMMKYHYSPLTPMVLVDNLDDFEVSNDLKIGFIRFKNQLQQADNELQIILSPTGDLNEAAKNLYAALHEMDKKNVELIIAEKVPHQGIGIAINDRLLKASSR